MTLRAHGGHLVGTMLPDAERTEPNLPLLFVDDTSQGGLHSAPHCDTLCLSFAYKVHLKYDVVSGCTLNFAAKFVIFIDICKAFRHKDMFLIFFEPRNSRNTRKPKAQ